MSNVVEKGIHTYSESREYVYDDDPHIISALTKFSKYKLGFMTHFGLFSQLGITESWGLSKESDQDFWSQEEITWTSHDEFVKQYRNLIYSFNPVKFNSDYIVGFLKRCGFKYFIIPTKHHDGFCLWDTNETNFKVSNSQYKNDITSDFINSCNKYNICSGLYFSKADWNSIDYWDKNYSETRYPSYDPLIHSEKWSRFVSFTHRQIEELCKLGKIDILWLDSGWINKKNNLDIEIEEISKIARGYNDSTLIVDRTCGSKYENYITPELTIPDEFIDVPFESNITLGHSFAYKFDDNYKDEYELSKLFLMIVCRGGNMLLNVALQGDGELPKKAQQVIYKFSKWYVPVIDIITNSKCIYPYFKDKCGYLNYNDDDYIFRINRNNEIINNSFYINYSDSFSKIILIYEEINYEVNYEVLGDNIKVIMPKEIRGNNAPLSYIFKVVK